MSFQYAHLMSMTPNELHMHLMRRNIPPEIRAQIKATVLEQKAIMRSTKAQTKTVSKQWQPLFHELRRERESVRASIKYHSRTDEESPIMIAYQAYALVLERLRDTFEGYKRERKTPAVLARELELPNKGTHWVDWVKPRFIQRVSDLFALVEHKHKARIKEPFVRTISVALHEKQKEKLRERTASDLEVAKLDAETNPSQKNMAKRAKLESALRRIDRMLPTDPVPRHWSGLFNENGDTLSP